MKERLEVQAKAIVNLLAESSIDPLKEFSILKLRHILFDILQQEEVKYAYILDEEGKVLTDGTKDNKLRGKAFDDDVGRKAALTPYELVQFYDDQQIIDVATPVFLSGKKIGGVRVGFSSKSIEAQIAAIRDRNILLGCVLMFLGIVFSFALGRVLTLPIRKLVKGTKALADGDFDYRVNIGSHDELESLAGSFNAMADSLKNSRKGILSAKDYSDSIISNIVDVLIVTDPYGKIKTVNRSALDLLGYEEGELVNKQIGDILSAQDLLNDLQDVILSAEMDELKNYGTCLRQRKGSCAPVVLSRSIVRTQDGSVAHIIYSGKDIIDLTQAEEALKASESRYAMLIRAIPDVIYELDPEGNFTFVSESVRKLGYEPDKLIGKHFKEIIHPDDVNSISRREILPKYKGKVTGDAKSPKLFDERRTGKRATADLRARVTIRNKEGIILDYCYTDVYSSGKWAQPQSKEEKEFLGSFGIIRDITSRKRMEDMWARYEFIMNTSKDLMAFVSKDYRYEALNDAYCRAHASKQTEMVGKSLADFWDESIFDNSIKPYLDDCFSGREVRYQSWIKFPAFEDRFFDIALYPYYNDEGKVTHAVSTSRDITEYHIAENRFRSVYKMSRDIIEKAPFGIYVVNSSGTIDYVNPAMLELSGLNHERFAGMNVFELLMHKETGLSEKIKQGLNGDYFTLGPVEYAAHAGKVSVRNFFGIPLEEEGTNKLLLIVEDITERSKAQEALEYRLEFERIIAQLSKHFINISPNEADSAVNEALKAVGEFVNVDSGLIFLSSQADRVMNNAYEWFAEGAGPEIKDFKRINLHDFKWLNERIEKLGVVNIFRVADLSDDADNEKSIFLSQGIKSLVAVPMIYAGRPVGFLCFVTTKEERSWSEDVISLFKIMADIFVNALMHKQAQEILRQEKERLAVTLRSISDGVITTDIWGNVVLLNRVAEKLTDYSQQKDMGKPIDDIFKTIHITTRAPCINPVREALLTGITVTLPSALLVSAEGRERIVEQSAAAIKDAQSRIVGSVLVFRDITEKQRMEEELLRTHKIESVGILAGGIAHDFNNILTGILSNITFAKIKSEPHSDTFEALVGAESAALRAKDLTHQLLTFSKGGAPIKKTAAISDLIKDSASFSLSGSNARCHFSIPDDIWPVEVDSGQISQVIQNIVINAEQAMPEGGVVKVKVENITLTSGYNMPLDPGRYVKVSVKDEGIGISPEHLSKIFDPYFSTKKRGSGLGLATAFAIITKHDGYITVESGIGKGTVFYIYLPASTKPLSKETKHNGSLETGEGFVLVMDDEELIRNTLKRVLTALGYKVMFAQDGAEAVEMYKKAKEEGNTFDAVILDLTVPAGMGGEEAVRKLCQIDPDVKAIASSGYSNDPIMADYKKYGFYAAVAKPYNIEEIGRTLSTVIGKSKDKT
ncbi:MAG: PAS domain S-box protein [Candidatus Omnitrophota bacterium]